MVYHSAYYDPVGPMLLEGALSSEINLLIDHLTASSEIEIGPYRCVLGNYGTSSVVVLQTEEDSSNAAASTALAIEHFRPRAVINQGTAGGHDPALHTFDIVLGRFTEAAGAWMSKASGPDEGVDYRQITMAGVYGYDDRSGRFIKKPRYYCDKELIEAAIRVRNTYNCGKIVEGVISTSDEWNNQVDRLIFLHDLTGSSCEEKESNAAAVICSNYGIPFLAVRIISNTGIYHEEFNPKSREACQEFVISVAEEYLTRSSQASAAWELDA